MASGQGRRRKVNEEELYEESIKRAKTAADVQRLRLEKLMKNPEKPVVIPNPKKEWKPPQPPEFVRNVVGSSAGAGSGEYHIYRNLRKREMLRQEYITKETLDQAYQDRVEQKMKEAEAKTAKKRAKRLKRKLKAKQKSKQKNKTKGDEELEGTDEDEDDSSKEEPSTEEMAAAGDGEPSGGEDEKSQCQESSSSVTAKEKWSG